MAGGRGDREVSMSEGGIQDHDYSSTTPSAFGTSPGGGGIEPIAIVGMACRVPGAGDVDRFWRNLVDGVESIRGFTREEQLAIGVPEEQLDDPAFVPASPVLDDFDRFDAACFGMTSREAELSDPQQRLFLELCHTALEDAGHDPARFPGPVGVYGGTGDTEYLRLYLRRNRRVMALSSFLSLSIGSNPDYLATFVSYKLDLRGPSLTLHTACSTSLVAVHLACEALRNRECDLALAGGACIEVPHGAGYLYAEGGIESADGHCRPFDAAATGTLWGSGGGAVVLRRLDDALADGDHVRAVILGWSAPSSWPASTPARSRTWRLTGPARRSATRSRSPRWRPSTAAAPRTGAGAPSARSSRTWATSARRPA
jgi:acyl transferase domain-containing protein